MIRKHRPALTVTGTLAAGRVPHRLVRLSPKSKPEKTHVDGLTQRIILVSVFSSNVVELAIVVHFRVRRDRVDKTGSVTLRHNSRLHHIGIGRAHKHTAVTLLVADRDIRIIAT